MHTIAKVDAFKARIHPLLDQIRIIAEEEGINFFAAFACDEHPQRGLLWATAASDTNDVDDVRGRVLVTVHRCLVNQADKVLKPEVLPAITAQIDKLRPVAVH